MHNDNDIQAIDVFCITLPENEEKITSSPLALLAVNSYKLFADDDAAALLANKPILHHKASDICKLQREI